MGQDISKHLTPPPLTLQDCLVDGRVDIIRYIYYKRRMDDLDESFDLLLNQSGMKKRKLCDFAESNAIIKSKKSRTCRKNKLLIRHENGELMELKPCHTIWYRLYVHSPPQNERMQKLFRNRFRLPYDLFIDLVDDVSNHELFSRWTNTDCTGSLPSNLKLLLLGSLRYIGRSWTFDDIEEANGISREVNRKFFIAFIQYGSSIMYKKYVIDKAININNPTNEILFRMAGMNGCLGSSDATHVIMLKCSSWATIGHKGFKLNLPARNYNLTVTHTKQILSTTTGHPATWNDKTIVLFDELICNVHNGEIYQDNEFKLYEYDLEGNIIEVTYKGGWFMVDNGYLAWSCTVPPVKDASSYETIRFSEWLESMRKQVECTFGIMKQRFSMLRHGIRLSSIKNCDLTWITCCALHNMLLFHDGFDTNWNSTDFESSLNGVSHNNPPADSSFAMNRLNREMTGNISTSNTRVNPQSFHKYTVDGKRVVSKMPLNLFRDCLVRHFDIRFKNNSVHWPKHMGNKPSNI